MRETMRDRVGDPLGPWRRFALLGVAFVFVFGCAVLTLGVRAVPRSELAAVTAAVLYVLAASVLQPASQSTTSSDRIKPLALDKQFRRVTIRFCLATSLLISLVIPWAWIAFFSPSYEQVKLLGPHLFLMMAQVLFEIWSYRTTVSVVVRIGIPVGFVSYRMRLLLDWVQQALAVKSTMPSDVFMSVLALSNLCFWGIVLFYVLLLKVCPPYFLERGGLVRPGPAPPS